MVKDAFKLYGFITILFKLSLNKLKLGVNYKQVVVIK